MKGYLDRIENAKLAVILVEELSKEFIIPKTELPDKSGPGTWLDITIENGTIATIQRNEKNTAAEKQKTDDLMAKLRAKSNGSKFKR